MQALSEFCGLCCFDFRPANLTGGIGPKTIEKTLAFDTDFKHTFGMQTRKELNDGR